MVVGPGVEVKAIKGDTLSSDWDDGYLRTHFAVEPILVHPEIRRCIAKANEARVPDAEIDRARTAFRFKRCCTV